MPGQLTKDSRSSARTPEKLHSFPSRCNLAENRAPRSTRLMLIWPNFSSTSPGMQVAVCFIRNGPAASRDHSEPDRTGATIAVTAHSPVYPNLPISSAERACGALASTAIARERGHLCLFIAISHASTRSRDAFPPIRLRQRPYRFDRHRLAGADQVEKTANQYDAVYDHNDDGHPVGNGQQNASGAGCICSSLIAGAILQA